MIGEGGIVGNWGLMEFMVESFQTERTGKTTRQFMPGQLMDENQKGAWLAGGEDFFGCFGDAGLAAWRRSLDPRRGNRRPPGFLNRIEWTWQGWLTMGKTAIALIAGWFSVGLATIGWLLMHGAAL
jgi:hypothetical protein